SSGSHLARSRSIKASRPSLSCSNAVKGSSVQTQHGEPLVGDGLMSSIVSWSVSSAAWICSERPIHVKRHAHIGTSQPCCEGRVSSPRSTGVYVWFMSALRHHT